MKHKSERPISHHVHHEDYPNIGYYHADASDLQDGVSKTPTGATLSVAVGKKLYIINVNWKVTETFYILK